MGGPSLYLKYPLSSNGPPSASVMYYSRGINLEVNFDIETGSRVPDQTGAELKISSLKLEVTSCPNLSKTRRYIVYTPISARVGLISREVSVGLLKMPPGIG